MELLFFAGFGLEGGEKPTALGRSGPSTKGITRQENLIKRVPVTFSNYMFLSLTLFLPKIFGRAILEYRNKWVLPIPGCWAYCNHWFE